MTETIRSDKLKESQKKYYNTKLKTNPEYVKKRNAYNNAYYALMSQNKEWLNARNNKQKKYGKQWRKRKENQKLQQKIDKLKNELNQ